MSWWAWLVIVLLLVLLVPIGAIIVAVWVDQWVTGVYLRSITTQQLHHGNSNGRLIVHLPGILADGHTSCKPVLETWLRHGDVATIAYGGERFCARSFVRIAASRLNEIVMNYQEVVLVGSSLGGMLALDLRKELHCEHASVIIVDAPSGAADMLGGGNIGAPLLRLLPFAQWSNRLLGPMMQTMLVPPKDENIEESLNKEELKQQALADMSRWPLSIWRDQLAYMAARPRLNSRDFVDFESVVYLSCDRNNETVKQPAAADAYRRAAGASFRKVSVDSTHCGYVERPTVWSRVFDQELSVLTR